jgi:hypothetical protein
MTITGGLVNTETVTTSATGTFNTKDVLTANLVTVNSSALANGTNGGLASNYTVGTGQTVGASITPYALTATVAAPNKVYNGNTTAAPTLTITGGFVNLETVSATAAGTFNTKDVVTANLVTVNSTALADGLNGGLASNYSLATGQTVTAFITPVALTATVIAPNKVYDGNTSTPATLNITSGLVGLENITATGTGTFNTKDVLTANRVTVNSTTLADGLNGSLASNYTLGTGQSVAANITPRTVSVTGTRVYDRTTNVAAGSLALSPLVGAETLTLAGSGTVADRNAGALKPLTLGTLALGNGTGLASNYTTNGGTHTASITPAPLALTTVDVVKVYDGNLSALGTAVVAGDTLFAGDTISGGTFAYTDPSVGLGNKTVTTAAVALSDGNSGGNYTVRYVNNTTSSITALPVIVPVVPVVPLQILSFQESLRRTGLSLTPTITVSGSASPVLIVDAFALETGNGRAVNSTLGMARTGPDLLLADASQSQRYRDYTRANKKPAVTKNTLIGSTP